MILAKRRCSRKIGRQTKEKANGLRKLQPKPETGGGGIHDADDEEGKKNPPINRSNSFSTLVRALLASL